MKVKKRYVVLMSLVALVAAIGAFFPETPGIWEPDEKFNAANVAWMITATIFVLMMTPGLSFFYGGMVGRKNVISTILQSFIAMGIISMLWVVVGFSLSFGDDVGGLGLIGSPSQFFMFRDVGAKVNEAIAPTIPLALFALFQMKFAIITPSLITGAFAERVRFSAYLVFMMLFCVFIYCPLAHWTWHPDGFLHNLMGIGIHDFAGGIVVHASSGVAALAGALFLGRRTKTPNAPTLPANIPFVILGAAMLWLGWFGFNGGSSLAADGIAVKAFLNTNTSGATAMMAWVLFDCLRGRKPSGMGAAAVRRRRHGRPGVHHLLPHHPHLQRGGLLEGAFPHRRRARRLPHPWRRRHRGDHIHRRVRADRADRLDPRGLHGVRRRRRRRRDRHRLHLRRQHAALLDHQPHDRDARLAALRGRRTGPQPARRGLRRAVTARRRGAGGASGRAGRPRPGRPKATRT